MHEHGMQTYGYDLVKKSIAGIETYTEWKRVPKPDAYVITVSSDSVEDVCKMISEKDRRSFVSVESTVKVGTCRKISNKFGLRTLVHCPERYWVEEPKTHGVRQLRVIGAINEQSLEKGLEFYRALDIPVHVCSDIEVAEACKITENAYRFVQIAFAEELKRICEDRGIPFEDLRTACNTKWNIQILEARDGIYGSCLPKDTGYLKAMAGNALIPLIEGAIASDEFYKKWVEELKRKTR